MKNEAEFKAAFKKSVRAQKGFAISLAAPMLVGIPDLYVIMPGFMPILLEAKWLGIVGNKFKRKIQYTAFQKHYIDECNKVRDCAAMGLVGYKQDKIYWACLVGSNNNGTISTDNTFPLWNDTIYCPYNNKQFDILGMFQYHRVPRFDDLSKKIESKMQALSDKIRNNNDPLERRLELP